MKELENLTFQEKEILLKAPAYISLLAANTDGKMDEVEKKAAIKFSHIKSFSGNELLKPFYKEVEEQFMDNIESLDKTLPKGKEERDAAIKAELEKLNSVYPSLGKEASTLFEENLKAYAEHVANSHWNVAANMLLPLPQFP